MHGVFITGTSTDVGKTFVGAAIARALTRRKVKVIPRKPVESGCARQGEELIPLDATALKAAADYPGALSEVCRYRFEPPLSPVRAARLANRLLSTEQLLDACLQSSENGFLLAEGAGGFYSPLSEDGLNADLAAALQLPVLLVADDRLGVLSQVLLNAEAMQTRGLHLVAVVLNQLQGVRADHMDNSADLRERLDCPVFTIPYSNDDTVDVPGALIEALISPSKSKGPNISAAG